MHADFANHCLPMGMQKRGASLHMACMVNATSQNISEVPRRLKRGASLLYKDGKHVRLRCIVWHSCIALCISCPPGSFKLQVGARRARSAQKTNVDKTWSSGSLYTRVADNKQTWVTIPCSYIRRRWSRPYVRTYARAEMFSEQTAE